MHQTLFYIPKEIAGISIFGVGWLLGLLVLGAIGTTVYLAVRHKRSTAEEKPPFLKELLGQVPFWALLAVIVVWVLPLIMKGHRGLPIRGYGVMLLLAVVTAMLLSVWRGRRIGMTPDMVISLTFWLFVPGILGARVFFVIEYWHTFQRDTLGATLGQLMSITEGGLVVYGSVIGGILGCLVFTMKNHLRFLAVADMLAPSLMLGIAIGRIGCLMNGCCFGGPCDHSWAITFPPNSPPYMSQIERGQLLGVQFSSDPNALPILSEVKPDSSAYKAGLRSGDQITQINRLPTENTYQLQRLLFLTQTLNVSKPLTATKQDGSTVQLPVEAVMTPQESFPHVSQADRGQWLGARFAPERNRPPTLLDVTPDTPAYKAGFRSGDQITELNGQPIGDTDQLQQLLLLAQTLSASELLTIKKEDGSTTQLPIVPLPERSLPIHPTQIYSSINAFILCLFLLAISPFLRREGMLFALLMTIYPITRFLLEIIRTDETAIFGTGLSISQNVSILFLVGIAGLWLYIMTRKSPNSVTVQDGLAEQ